MRFTMGRLPCASLATHSRANLNSMVCWLQHQADQCTQQVFLLMPSRSKRPGTNIVQPRSWLIVHSEAKLWQFHTEAHEDYRLPRMHM